MSPYDLTLPPHPVRAFLSRPAASRNRIDVSCSKPLARTRVSAIGVLDTHAVEALDRAIQEAEASEHSLILDLHEIVSVTPEALDDLAGRTTTQSALTRQLLSFSRGHAVEPVVLDLNDTVRGLESRLRRLIRSNVTINTALAPAPLLVRADRGQIEQTIVNLVVNAGDAMPGGGQLTIATSDAEPGDDYDRLLSAGQGSPGHYAVLEVTDTGSGIDQNTLSHVFEPFFTAKAEGRETGLGLATVYDILRESAGFLQAYSEPGHGTSFKASLPLVAAAVASQPGAWLATSGGSDPLAELAALIDVPTPHAAAPAEYRARVAVARQPIVDRSEQIVGFELLHRPMPIHDADAATSNVILRSVADIGLERLVGAHPAYINVTREFLLDIRPLPLAPERFVLELLENQTIDEPLLEVLRELAAAGFRIALDDFCLTDGWESLIEIAAMVKLDIHEHAGDALADTVARLRDHDVTLIAEKIETRAEYELCRALGFDAFQGYYFAEPQLVIGRSAPAQRLGARTTGLEELERLIGQDPRTQPQACEAGQPRRTPARLASCSPPAKSSGVTRSKNSLNLSTTSSVSSTSCSNSIADSAITSSAAKIGAPERTASASASLGRESISTSRPFTDSVIDA